MLTIDQIVQSFRTAEDAALDRANQLRDAPTKKALQRRADIAHLAAAELERQAEAHPNSGEPELDPDDVAKIILNAFETICGHS